ncbi:unnamed protein product, partial [Ixodes pacificus]
MCTFLVMLFMCNFHRTCKVTEMKQNEMKSPMIFFSSGQHCDLSQVTLLPAPRRKGARPPSGLCASPLMRKGTLTTKASLPRDGPLPHRTPPPQFHLSFILKQLSVPRRNGTAAPRVVANEAQWRGPGNTPSSKNSLSLPHSRLYSFRARLRANRRHRSRGKEMDG